MLRLRVRAMGSHALPSLLPSLKATEQTERIWAIKLLGDIRDESALPYLQATLNSSQLDALERTYSVEAISRFSSTDAVTTLQNLRNDNDPKVRHIAIRALERIENSLKMVPSPAHNTSMILTGNLTQTLTDAEFLRQFETTILPQKLWTHEAHIRMAYLYLCQTPNIDTLLPQVRNRIISYNQVHGNYNGYHETMTAAYLRIVKSRMESSQAENFEQFKRGNLGIFQNTYLLRYYSEAVLFSFEARQNFIAPDREPLP